MNHLKRERDAQWVFRSTLLVDPTRNVARGGRAIDPDAPSTIELALDIDDKGQLEPVRVRLIPRADDDGHTMRLIAGYRRIAAMDRNHRKPDGKLEDYRVHVLPSNATTDLEEAGENFSENNRLPTNDWDVGEGLSALRRAHNLTVDHLILQLFAKAPGTLMGRERARKCLVTWENLIEPLRQLWRKNTSLFQLMSGRPVSAWDAARKTPAEQEELLDAIVHEAQSRKERAAVGLDPRSTADDAPQAVTLRRPTARQINMVAGWLKQHAADPHDDGLTRDQRVFARRFIRWLLSIPSKEGAAPDCPIKKRDKARLEDDEGEQGAS
jgi:hypothetical protein